MPSTVTILAAGLGANHGYTIDGDSVHLHADLVVYDPVAASSREWSLQLWACQDPFRGGAIIGHSIAEARIGSLSRFTHSPSPFHATAALHTPAGGGEFTMVLLIVTAAGEIHGYHSYPRQETLSVPRLRGPAGYRIDGRRIMLDVTAIENPRAASNLSGTLALELWAIAAPYSDGHFNGAPLAAAVLGTLAGQSEWNPPSLDLVFKAPPDGTWHLCLMLREWTGTGYTTRDYTNFAEPVAFTSASPANGEAPPTQAPFTAETTNQPAPEPEHVAPPKKPARRAATKKPAPAAEPAPAISINKSTVSELTAVKGITKTIAAAIIAARPVKSLEALTDIKGLGPKLYAKLKPSLKL